MLEGIEPAKQKAKEQITVVGSGFTKDMLGPDLIIHLQLADDKLVLNSATIGEEGGLVLTLPEDIPLGACSVIMSFDGGQTWTPGVDEGAPSFTVSKK